MENIYNKRRNRGILMNTKYVGTNYQHVQDPRDISICAGGKKGRQLDSPGPENMRTSRCQKYLLELWRPSLRTETENGKGFYRSQFVGECKETMQCWLCNMGECNHDRWC